MTPKEIGKESSLVSLTRQDVDTLKDWAIEKGDLERAVGFAGLASLMDVATPVEETTLTVTETEADDLEPAGDSEARSGNRVTNVLRSGVKRIRGAKRPKKFQNREKYTYGSGF